MTLKEYLKGDNRKAFAKKIQTTKAYVDQLCSGQRRPSPDLAACIEKATGGQVNRMELLYPESSS